MKKRPERMLRPLVRYKLRGYVFARGELQLAFLVCVDDHVISVQPLAFENLDREWILDQALDRTLQRPRTVDRIVARFEDGLARCIGELQHDAPIGEQFAQVVQTKVDDVLELRLVERMEDDD